MNQSLTSSWRTCASNKLSRIFWCRHPTNNTIKRSGFPSSFSLQPSREPQMASVHKLEKRSAPTTPSDGQDTVGGEEQKKTSVGFCSCCLAAVTLEGGVGVRETENTCSHYTHLSFPRGDLHLPHHYSNEAWAAEGLQTETANKAECGRKTQRPSLRGAWGGTDSSGAVFFLLQGQGPSFTKGVRPLRGRVNHLGKVPPSGLGHTSITSFLFTPPKRRSECCWSTFNRLEMQLQTNFQSPPYPFLLSLVRDDEMPSSREDLETLSPSTAE